MHALLTFDFKTYTFRARFSPITGGAARAAPVQPWKHGFGHVYAAVLARQRQRFGPGFIPLAPFPLVPINTPLGVLQEDIQRVV